MLQRGREKKSPQQQIDMNSGITQKGKNMNRTLISLLALAGMFVGGASAEAQQCSNSTLQGAYGFHAFATIVSPGSPGTPRAIIGVFTLDGRGSWTSKLTLDDNGSIIPRSDTGTYIVNADCTGTLFPASGGSVEIVVVDGGREFYQMRTNPASVVLYGVTKKIFLGENEGN
jgi:hypothetical protein